MKWWVRSIILSVVWVGLVIAVGLLHSSLTSGEKSTPERDERMSELYGQIAGFGAVSVWIVTSLMEMKRRRKE